MLFFAVKTPRGSIFHPLSMQCSLLLRYVQGVSSHNVYIRTYSSILRFFRGLTIIMARSSGNRHATKCTVQSNAGIITYG